MADGDAVSTFSQLPPTSRPSVSPTATLASLNQHALATTAPLTADWRLRRHADYQRVYQASRKHSSPSMSYFFALRCEAQVEASCASVEGAPGAAMAAEKGALPLAAGNGRQRPSVVGPRVGLTAGKVLGNAVMRNRIKRRMREAVRMHVATLSSDVDVILHPRKFVATLEFAKLQAEVGRIFAGVQSTLDRQREKA